MKKAFELLNHYGFNLLASQTKESQKGAVFESRPMPT